MPKKMLWKVGVYSCLSECLIRDGRDSAKRVVSDTYTLKCSHPKKKQHDFALHIELLNNFAAQNKQ